MTERLAREVGEYAHTQDFKSSAFRNSTMFYGTTTRLPDLLIFFSTMDNVFRDHRAVVDANALLIPTVGIVDTASDPTFLTFPVPGNDDTPCAIEFYSRVFKRAVQAGKAYADRISPS